MLAPIFLENRWEQLCKLVMSRDQTSKLVPIKLATGRLFEDLSAIFLSV